MKSLHIRIVRIDNIDNSMVVEDAYVPSNVTSVFYKAIGLALGKFHVNMENTSGVQGALVKSSTSSYDVGRYFLDLG